MASVPPTAPTLTETYPEFINLWFKLTVTDRNGNQDSDTVYVRIEDLSPETFQIPPAAHTVVNYPEGAEAFLENTRVTPDGSGSNEPGQRPHCQLPVGADWPDRGTLSNATRSRATFTTPTGLSAFTTHRFRLTVTDNKNLTHTAEVTVRVKAAPTAEAGENQEVKEGATITLRGSGTGYPGETLTYLWSGVQTETPGAPILILPTDTASATLTVTAPTGLTADAGYHFFLTVVDYDCLTATGEAFVRVKAANAVKRPTAHAGPDQTNKRICHDRV